LGIVDRYQARIVPYQVTWDGPKERHQKALIDFAKEFPAAAKGVVVTRANVEEFLKE